MNALFLAAIMLGGFVLAYNTYGRFLGKKIFKLAADAMCPRTNISCSATILPRLLA